MSAGGQEQTFLFCYVRVKSTPNIIKTVSASLKWVLRAGLLQCERFFIQFCYLLLISCTADNHKKCVWKMTNICFAAVRTKLHLRTCFLRGHLLGPLAAGSFTLVQRK